VARSREVLAQAFAEGEISEGSSSALLKVEEIGDKVDDALGDDTPSGDVLLVSVLVDDSYSIGQEQKRVRAVIEGHNRMIEAAGRRAGSTDVLFHTRYFSTGVLASYRPVDRAVQLSKDNYRAQSGVTPLFEQSVVTLGSVIAKARELGNAGCNVRTFTLLLTDGADNAGESTAKDVRLLVTDMLDFADTHIVAGMGIGERPYFEKVFRDMGIPSRWILTADSTVAEIEETFARISRALELAATSEHAFRAQLESGPTG
jgi:hypothetical protein